MRSGPTPTPGPGQALVEMAATGVNFVEIYQRRGWYPIPLPGGLGGEGAGVVQAVGPDVTVVKPGDRVAFLVRFRRIRLAHRWSRQSDSSPCPTT